MNSVFFNSLGGVLTILATISFGYAYWLKHKESAEATRGILSHQDKSTEDVKSHVTSQMAASTDAILATLKEANQTLQSNLRDKYPLGYIFFGVRGPELKDIVFRPGQAVMNADWYATQIVMDTQHKVARVTIPNPSWKQTSSPGKTVVNGNAVWTGEYTLGKPVEFNFGIRTVGQPKTYLEVIDDTGSVAICVIGFK
jgi:hypothetical protein